MNLLVSGFRRNDNKSEFATFYETATIEHPMFLIAGVSPKIKILDTNPRICPVCGLTRAYYKRVDHYFNLFFIPILRVKKGKPFIMCDRCERTVHEFKEEYRSTWSGIKKTHCNHCGKTLEKDFGYCPYCGKPVAPK